MTSTTTTMVCHLWLPHWLALAGYNAPANEPGKLRQCLAALGINNRGWKLYAEYGDGLLRPLGSHLLCQKDPNASLANALAYLRLLSGCESDIAPPKELVASLGACNLPGGSISELPTTLFRGAWRALVEASYEGVPANVFVETEFVPAMRWLFAQSVESITDTSRGKASWLWLRRRWSDEVRLTSLPSGTREWSTPIRDALMDGFRFLPIQSGSALEDEGEAMHHCVAALADCCRKGCVRVFSVRDANTFHRVATLAIRGERRSWVLGDLRGVRNAPPEGKVIQATSGFLGRVQNIAAAPAVASKECEECIL